MNEVVIRILDTDNSVLGDLDLTNFNDFPLALTDGIVNLDNLKARTGTYSKSFKIPNTKNNATLLSNIDNINSRKDYRDALNRKPCVIIVNNNQINRGFVQANKCTDTRFFELVFFGNNIDWVKSANELKLDEITYRKNTQTYDQNGINVANAADSDTYDHAYPYVSRGGNTQSYNTVVEDYYPVFYLRSILERGLNQLGWNISSSFLEDADIKRLVCDFSLKFLLSEAEINDTRLRASKTGADSRIDYNDEWRINFDDDSTTPNEDVGSNYDNTTFLYTIPETGNYDISFTISTVGTVITSSPSDKTQLTDVYLVANGTSGTSMGGGIVANTRIATSKDINVLQTSSADFNGSFFEAGDTLSLYFKGTGYNTFLNTEITSAALFGNFDIKADTSANNTYFKVQRKAALEDGDSYALNDVIPDDVTLLDVINDFTRMFNVYYWTDTKSRTIYFEPRNDFFNPQTQAKDWTNKLDISRSYEVDYVSSYKRNMTFSYRDIDNDKSLEAWQDVNKRTYASYNHVLPDRFGEGTTEIKLGVFSASYSRVNTEAAPLVNGSVVPDISPVSIQIWNHKLSTLPLTRIEEYNPKIYLFNNGGQTSAGGSTRLIEKFNFATPTIPYGIFESYSEVTSDINLSFTGEDGLFATYYSNMMKNIEEGGRLTAYFKLSNNDIENQDFRDLVYLSVPANLKGYYFVEVIKDFKPLEDGTTKVNLFKYEDLGNVDIDTSQQGNNSSGTDGSNTTPTPEPIYIEDGSGQLIEVAIIDPLTGVELVYL